MWKACVPDRTSLPMKERRSVYLRSALDAGKGGPVEEGVVGGGTGMHCFSFKGGIGTASRAITPSSRIRFSRRCTAAVDSPTSRPSSYAARPGSRW